MAIIKCKMCGGDLEIEAGMTIAECEYCGTKQTIPTADNEKKMTLFSRANRLRFACEFDKAAGVYENLVAEFPEEAEAYWGLVLCKYGIEYVDDPATGKKIPTCHRSSFESVMEDLNFEQACENADAVARKVYREEAKAIEELRRGIIEVSGKEDPYDIFICYKETDENGERTLDSVLAQDVYDALTEKGYRVFFSRITLEDKLGQEYEPYIFAALNSAKVMLAFGTDYEYFNAVWVKNEWSRYLQLMTQDKSKYLIPCYKGIDAYDMPKEFSKLQAQDLGKVGATQDLLRGIEKLIGKKETVQVQSAPVVQQIIQSGGPNVEALLKRGNMALEDGDWDKAIGYFEQVLDMDAECTEAYLGKACAAMRCHTAEEMGEWRPAMLDENRDFRRALQYANDVQRGRLELIRKKAQQYEEELNRLEEERVRQEDEQREQEAERKRQEEEQRKRKQEKLRRNRELVRNSIYIEDNQTIGLKSDGTMLAEGENGDGQCRVSGWHDIVAFSASGDHTVGLKADGTVIATGNNEDGQCNVRDWRDVVAVSTSLWHTVGVKSDGTVVTAGREDDQSDMSGWRDIVAVSAETYHIVGLRSDGTVVAVGENENGRCNVSGWRNIVSVAAVEGYTVGLRADGTVVVAGSMSGRTDYGQFRVQGWRDIVSIATDGSHTVGLKADGTVVATGFNEDGQCNVQGWRNIVAVAVSTSRTVGLRSDGTLVAAGESVDYDFDLSDWKLFDSFDNLEEERRTAREARRQRVGEGSIRKIDALVTERASLESEILTLKGLFARKRFKEISKRLAEIEAELKQLQ